VAKINADGGQRLTMWQLPEQTTVNIMSYVLRTPRGRIIVIDGGTEGDAPYLRGFLGALGNKVEAWFVSHLHCAHYFALQEILRSPRGIGVKAVYGSLPEGQWLAQHVPNYTMRAEELLTAIAGAGLRMTDVQLGQELGIDGVRIEVLGVRNPEITGQKALNNQSMVLRISDAGKSVLFLADLCEVGGKKLLAGPYRDRLKSDYVQIAHHGQQGVSEEVYRAIAPMYCLWPTPQWLWDNAADPDSAPGSGSWRVPQIRKWLDNLAVKAHYVSKDGLVRID